jgi:hypothetical protein
MFGPVFVRRRPLLRAAVVGGGAYMAGKASARNRAAREQQEADQDERIAGLEQRQAVPAPARSAEPSTFEQLTKLTTMHDQGQLTDTEFSAAKAKLLGM